MRAVTRVAVSPKLGLPCNPSYFVRHGSRTARGRQSVARPGKDVGGPTPSWLKPRRPRKHRPIAWRFRKGGRVAQRSAPRQTRRVEGGNRTPIRGRVRVENLQSAHQQAGEGERVGPVQHAHGKRAPLLPAHPRSRRIGGAIRWGRVECRRNGHRTLVSLRGRKAPRVSRRVMTALPKQRSPMSFARSARPVAGLGELFGCVPSKWIGEAPAEAAVRPSEELL